MSEFALQSHLDDIYQSQTRQFAFTATTPDELTAWQGEFRTALRRLLLIEDRILPANPTAELRQSVDRGDYVEEKYALDVGQSVPAPIYVLVPKTPPPYKPIIVFHGHNPLGVQYVLGNYPTVAEAEKMRAIDNNYAQELARAGYLVCAVEQRGFGERVTEQLSGPDTDRSCRHLAFEYMMDGRTLLGERCWDGMVAISYVKNRSDVVPDVLGCTGNSGGGTTTMWLTAIEDRITVNVTSCYFCAFKQSILGMSHCECNYVPGILPLAEAGDIAALIAPRPVRFIAGQQDNIFPIAGVRQEYETVKRAYDLLGKSDHVSLTVHPGGHAYNHAMSHEWFGQWL